MEVHAADGTHGANTNGSSPSPRDGFINETHRLADAQHNERLELGRPESEFVNAHTNRMAELQHEVDQLWMRNQERIEALEPLYVEGSPTACSIPVLAPRYAWVRREGWGWWRCRRAGEGCLLPVADLVFMDHNEADPKS
ncbi:hypothetical protein RJ55_04163 [Drechmeria coniospora]|nr:hypothetical protein RJ55_04163 [Drechmeria coniospora]